jgi:myo-inositol-1(or 4)-monophosphatase
VYERGLNPWDYGAGALVAAEAGARIGGMNGAEVSPEMSIAATPAVFDALHDALAAADPLRA